MNASAIIRKVKDLDALEIRVKQTVSPSQKMLAYITAEREKLLKGDDDATPPRK